MLHLKQRHILFPSAKISDLVSLMLELDAERRPSLAQVMAHPWLVSHLYRLPATLGALPCTSSNEGTTRPFSSVPSTSPSQKTRLKRQEKASPLVGVTQIVKVKLDDQSESTTEVGSNYFSKEKESYHYYVLRR